MDESVLGGKDLEFVISSSELIACIFLQVLSNSLSEADVSVETGTDSSATLSDLVHIFERLNDTLFTLLELVNVSTEFLTKSKRSSILGVGATNLHNVFPFVTLVSKGLSKGSKLGEEALISFHNSGDVHN